MQNKPYQEHSSDTWSTNGVAYHLNTIFEIAHNKPVTEILTKKIKSQINQSKRVVDGVLVCGSCYGHTKNINIASTHHSERVKNTDLSIPLIILKDNDKLRVVDGAHRLERALELSLTTLPVKYVTMEEIKKALLSEG